MGENTKEHKNHLKTQVGKYMIWTGMLFGVLSAMAFLLGIKAEKAMAGSLAMLILGIVFLLITMRFMQSTVQKVTDSLTYMEQKFEKFAQGDFSEEIETSAVAEEDFQKLTEYAETMRKNAGIRIRESVQKAAALSASIENLQERMTEMQRQMDEASGSAKEMADSMELIAAASDRIDQLSKEMQDLAEQTASRMEQSEEEVQAACMRAEGIREEALKRRQVVRHSHLGFKDSFARSLKSIQSVEEIVSLAEAVMEITEKTNLLSLNASIEAAKAGQAGSGFSVVADEIRKLADESKKTIENIQWIAGEAHFAIDSLKEDSNQLLHFVDAKVVSDFGFFLDMADAYGNDTETMKHMMSGLDEIRKGASSLADGLSEAAGQICNAGEGNAENIQKLKNL